ncbi:biopolymer transporter ExbD [Pedobacter yulinensis]|uniref:Biopolymer transporter ExbD n=1 Tax=Pedobacter yulinensis TaxID=2126353 RepID=A0A2T3HQU0_9SPHI|nr:biopolymer transporter ExbD [Pedobacter yulinensis]PST84825.1 biopolymer transporter ExbD [Pedobacter yulinensis]
MATLQIPQGSKARPGLPKTAPSTDLTAMVDLAFLLITFFMLTTSLSRFQAMDVARPVPSDRPAHYPASRTLTLVLGKNDRVLWYMGEPGTTNMKLAPLPAVRKVLLARKTELLKQQKDLIVIIKPAAASRYSNLVDILDELNITRVKTYTLADADQSLLAEEKAALRRNGI